MLSAILHGCNAWGDLSTLASKLESIELYLLKSALGVKEGTPIDTVYHELNRGSIVSKILDRQYAFIHKLENLSEEEALVVCFLNRSQHLSITQYYNSLDNSNYVRNKTERRAQRVARSVRCAAQEALRVELNSGSTMAKNPYPVLSPDFAKKKMPVL